MYFFNKCSESPHMDVSPKSRDFPNVHRATQNAFEGHPRASHVVRSDDVSELGDAPGDVDADEWSVSSSSLLKAEEEELAPDEEAPSRSRFFCFMRRFWNQIFTCVSFSSSVAAISTRRARVRYLLKWNSFSSSVSCRVLKLVRMALLGAPTRP